ncbi:Integral membrane protein [Pseudonocardia sp. Ae717_Ps2]|uniref:DUF4231 domain-containing protein n=1 Tax=Pseudonocardia sp. Ae717_Ps2 TaxID=1885573 RepID=UPI00094AF9F0|nr:DUF4231 domain-containing protein [Pseudonocardia sp. Ae717_Ps2]OLM33020.1 Integral membrane protein [Pseudonocardia sp. Ae717_Ps2]
MTHLTDHDLGAVYHAADTLSGSGQQSTRKLVRVELISVIVASITGITTFRVGDGRFDLLAVISGLAFLLALGASLRRFQRSPEKHWYQGRAAAETVRTLSWKFAMCADPFPSTLVDAQAENRFLNRVRRALHQLDETVLPLPTLGDRELTDAIRNLREADLATKREVYRRDRIQNQLKWYTRRSHEHNRLARIWIRAAIFASALGVGAAVTKFLLIDIDLLGVFAAVASSAVAWNQLNQHRSQAIAYTVTARELTIIKDAISTIPDAEWTQFVNDAEEAISREHTMWTAKNGVLSNRSLERDLEDER